MKILFKEQKTYNGVVYEAGKVYEITEERGMAKRWLDRGCVEVKGEALADPNGPAPVKKEEKKPEKKPVVEEKKEKGVAKAKVIDDTNIDL